MSDAPCDDIIRAYDEVCAENERLREALEAFADEGNWFDATEVAMGEQYTVPAWCGPMPEHPEGFARRALNLEADDE